MYWKLAPYVGIFVAGLLLGLLINSWRLGSHIQGLKAQQAASVAASEQSRAETEAKYRQIEKDAQSRVNLAIASYREEQQNAQADKDKRNAAIDAGARRLYVSAKCPVQTGHMSSDAGNSTGSVEAKHAELEPETARRILRYTDEGDDAIRQLDALITMCRPK